MSDPIDIDASRAICEAASRGPWRGGHVEKWHVYIPYADALEGPNGERVLLRMNEHFDYAADVEFIAHARTAFPAALDELAALREFVESINRLTRERDALRAELADSDRVREMLAALLTGVANAINGEPPELVLWDWSDLPKRAMALAVDSEALRLLTTESKP